MLLAQLQQCTAAAVPQVTEQDRLLLELRTLAAAARAMVRELQREEEEVAGAVERVAGEARSEVGRLTELMQGLGARQELAAAEKVRVLAHGLRLAWLTVQSRRCRRLRRSCLGTVSVYSWAAA